MPRLVSDSEVSIMLYVKEIFEYWGKDYYTCELCFKKLRKRGQIHHTKYDGATIYDLVVACKSCQSLDKNYNLI